MRSEREVGREEVRETKNEREESPDEIRIENKNGQISE